MLFQDKPLGRRGWWAKLVARLAMRSHRRRPADLDLLSLSAHLRRDIGLEDGMRGLVAGRTPQTAHRPGQ